MTQNPFDALGGAGGLDMNALMQQAAQMQAQLEEAQSRLTDQEVTGEVAGGAVSATVNGVGELRAVSIRPGAFDPDDAESLEELGDLVVAAYRDAKGKADEIAAQALGPLAGGGGEPGGLPGGLPGLG